MKRQSMTWQRALLAAVAVLLVLAVGVAAVPLFNLSWWTVDCGGSVNTIAGGAFLLSGTVGQPDTARMTGGEYVLQGGFWAVGPPGPTGSRGWEYYR